jgi:hypothetical protein
VRSLEPRESRLSDRPDYQGLHRITLADELIAHAADWDPSSHAQALSERPILLLGTEGNTDHDLLLEALQDVGADKVTQIVWQTDHLFSDGRIALSCAVVDWFRSFCDD